MSKKYYVVWKGRETGVFNSWADVKAQIDGQAGAQYMGFPSRSEAEIAFRQSYASALKHRSQFKKQSASTDTKNETYSNAQSRTAKRSATASQVSSQKPMQSVAVNIYCDGACSPNPGESGTGVAIYEKQKLTTLMYGLYNKKGTNNTAELNGLIIAFKLAKKYISKNENVQILTDSKYSIDCITKWADGWKKKGWTRGKGEEIKNLELIKAGHKLYKEYHNHLIITHVKGHADIEGNELADRMAVLARSNKEKDWVTYSGKMDIAAILAMASG